MLDGICGPTLPSDAQAGCLPVLLSHLIFTPLGNLLQDLASITPGSDRKLSKNSEIEKWHSQA